MLYGEPTIRKAVPLAIGLVSVSNPLLPILDTLSKYSHDNDLQVAINAIFAWGLLRTCWRRQEQCSVGPDAETISRLLSKGTWFIIYSLNCLRNGTYRQGDDRSQPVLLGQEYHEPTSCRGPVGNANSVHGCEIMWRSFFFFQRA